jgi:hypothetical protein
MHCWLIAGLTPQAPEQVFRLCLAPRNDTRLRALADQHYEGDGAFYVPTTTAGWVGDAARIRICQRANEGLDCIAEGPIARVDDGTPPPSLLLVFMDDPLNVASARKLLWAGDEWPIVFGPLG